MKKPLKNTPEAFCELAKEEIGNKNPGTIAGVATAMHISNRTWGDILSNKMPDLTTASNAKKSGWTRTITKICDYLGLDLGACLQACKLEDNNLGAIHQARTKTDLRVAEITEQDLIALLELVKKLQKPMPLSFALEYLSLLRKSEEQ